MNDPIPPLRLVVQDVSKSFAGVVALDSVGFQARAGSIHGILGENGAGKSTLMKIVYGLERPGAGRIQVDGVDLPVGSPGAASRAGIGMVHQHFALVADLSVVDNCVLGAGQGWGPVHRHAWVARIRATAARLHWDLDPEAKIADLGVGQRQRVEIVKALLVGGGHTSVLILDEPTAVLTPQEVDELIPALKALAALGTTVLFISHKLHEVERLCLTVTILRRGRVVYDGPRPERQAMAQWMVGEVPPTVNLQGTQIPGEPRLEVRDLTGHGLQGVSFTVHSGEVVAVAGVDGNGQEPLIQAVLRDARAVTTPGLVPADRLGGIQRLGLIPDDRQHEALVLPLGVQDNLVLKDQGRFPFATAWGWLHPARWREHAIALIARYGVRGGGPETPVQALSGGNQQKVVIARELHRNPGLIIAVNPTRGLDLAASAEVLRSLAAARDAGAAVLLIHHDLDELLAVADRVLVLYGGRLREAPGRDRHAIAGLMLGGGSP